MSTFNEFNKPKNQEPEWDSSNEFVKTVIICLIGFYVSGHIYFYLGWIALQIHLVIGLIFALILLLGVKKTENIIHQSELKRQIIFRVLAWPIVISVLVLRLIYFILKKVFS